MLDDFDRLNPESKKYIAWLNERLKDPEKYQELTETVIDEFLRFLLIDPDIIIDKITAKQVLGGLEYGAPAYPLARINKELEMEHTDLLGWTLIRLYNQSRPKK